MSEQVHIDEEGSNSMSEEENKSQFSADFRSDNEEDALHVQQQQFQGQVIKNPVSPYMIFVSGWKQSNPNEKLKISAMGEAWRALSQSEKSYYEEQFKQQKNKYEQYVSHMMSINPNFKTKNQNKYLFPLHRVKSIMKQDAEYKAGAQAVSAMSKATEYFGQYVLEEVKKHTQGKKRIDVNDLFETINTNQGNLWFLQCLIDEYNTYKVDPRQSASKKESASKKLQIQKKEEKKIVKKSEPKKPLLKGQMKITDMF